MDVTKLTKPARKLLKLRPCGAVIVAAGSASRMGGVDKIMAPLGGEPVIVHTLRAFQQCDAISQIVVVTRQDLIGPVMELCAGFDKVSAVILGGADRAESVDNGLQMLSDRIELAAIHDGARPLVSWQLIDRVVRAANSYGAAVPGIEVKDTVKTTDGTLIVSTPPRSTLRAIQTPQVFDRQLLTCALEQARKKQLSITDDSSAVEQLGFSVKLVPGEERNLKITTPMDLWMAEKLMEEDK